MKNTYSVHIRPVRPAWNDPGHQFVVMAGDKRDAAKQARRLAQANCIYDRTDGALKVDVSQIAQ